MGGMALLGPWQFPPLGDAVGKGPWWALSTASLRLGLLEQKFCIQARMVPSFSPLQVEIPRHRGRVTVSKGAAISPGSLNPNV